MDGHLRIARTAAVTVVPIPHGPSLDPPARNLKIKNDVGHALSNPHLCCATFRTRPGFVVDRYLLFNRDHPERFDRLFDTSADRFVSAHIDFRPLVVPIRSRVDLLEFGPCTRALAEGPLEAE